MKLLEELRISRGDTQEKIAKILGIPIATYADIESGKLNPADEMARKIARFFNVPLDNLLECNSSKWDQICFPPWHTEAYNELCTILLNLASSYGRKVACEELRKSNPEPARLIEIAKLCNYDASSLEALISNCIYK